MTDTNRLITSSEWLGIGLFSGIAYMVAKYGLKERSFDAEEFGAEKDWSECVVCKSNKATEGQYETIVCHDCAYDSWGRENTPIKDRCPSCYNSQELWVGDWMRCSKCNESMCENCETENYQVCEQCWADDEIRASYLRAEEFGAEDSRRRLKVLMEGKSKEERKRISKMVQIKGLENTIAELLAHAEAFAATSFDEDEDKSPKINRNEWMPRTDCEICARLFTINRFGQQLIQHYLKESDNGEKGWKSKKNADGTRRTARNIAGFFLYEYGLDALNQYVLFQEKTGVSDKVIELLRLSLVDKVIAGDVVNLIEMMDMGDEVDDKPIFGKKFKKDFSSEGK